jgi:hypothetical protein
MNMVRARGRLGAFLALTGILCLCRAAPVAAPLQRGQLRLEVRDPAGGGVAARGEILSQSNQFQRTFQVASNGNYLLQDVYRYRQGKSDTPTLARIRHLGDSWDRG